MKTPNKNKKIHDKQMVKIAKDLDKSIKNYRNTLKFMAADVPISMLCLPKTIESILVSNGCLRVYDIFNMELTKIKGLGDIRIREITLRLENFLSI